MKPTRLVLGWCAYWIVLAAGLIGPALPAVWRATRPDVHGTISGAYGDGNLSITVSQGGVTTWSGSISFTLLSLAIAVPPLVSFALWLRANRRTNGPVDEGRAPVR